MRYLQAAHLIRRYGNRRLYDTEESRCVTQQELAQKVKGGADIRVVDAKTGADLTQEILTQMLFEGRGASRVVPVPVLLELLRIEDTLLAEFLGRYLAAALETYLRARRGERTGSESAPLSRVPIDPQSAWARLLSPGTPAMESSMAPMGEYGQHERWLEPRSEMAELRSEVAELRTALRDVVGERKARAKGRRAASR
jgi:polyhydroxyalkanoate synthesis repressor PhaR